MMEEKSHKEFSMVEGSVGMQFITGPVCSVLTHKSSIHINDACMEEVLFFLNKMILLTLFFSTFNFQGITTDNNNNRIIE